MPNPDGKDEGLTCADGAECKSLQCTEGKCGPVTSINGQSPAPGKPDDGIKNGDESDVDCGGSKAPKCGVDKGCNTNADCTSDACSYAKKCIAFASCTRHFGGDTCGAGETGEADATHESCCTTVTNSDGLAIGKYHVTAGRMRAFIERYDGNLQKWAATNPKGWKSDWTSNLPSSLDEANAALGPSTKEGCTVNDSGARTYWQPEIDGDKNDFPQDVLDEKALNCVPWHLAQALCVSDGGRLPTKSEVIAIMTNDGENEWPWEFNDGSDSYDPEAGWDERVVHNWSYETPNLPAGIRMDGQVPLDRSFNIAPPGRRPDGANAIGVQDAVGNMLPWLNDGPNVFAWTLSWEEHPKLTQTNTWPENKKNYSAEQKAQVKDGYYAIGVRCVFDK